MTPPLRVRKAQAWTLLDGSRKDVTRFAERSRKKKRVLEAKVPHRGQVPRLDVKMAMVESDPGYDDMHNMSSTNSKRQSVARTRKIQMQARAMQQFSVRPGSVGGVADPFIADPAA